MNDFENWFNPSLLVYVVGAIVLPILFKILDYFIKEKYRVASWEFWVDYLRLDGSIEACIKEFNEKISIEYSLKHILLIIFGYISPLFVLLILLVTLNLIKFLGFQINFKLNSLDLFVIAILSILSSAVFVFYRSKSKSDDELMVFVKNVAKDIDR